jgi:oxygen-independent coproporphyrinogen-3 oxidase
VQQAVNRIQPADDTQALVEYARSLGFGAINFDLIYGLPHQSPDSWARTLERVISMRPDRMAVYSFAYVPEVRPHQKKIDRSWLPMGKDKLRLFLQTYEAFVNAGYKPIGMDHFALPEDELSRAQARRALGRNFQGYTVTAAPDSVAFGATGISDVSGAFSQSVRPLGQYYESIQSGRFAVERGLELTDDDKRRRALITQLMCNFWVDIGTDGYFDRELEKLRPFEQDGLLKIAGKQFELSTLGRLFVRNVAMIFDAYRATSQATFSRTV